MSTTAPSREQNIRLLFPWLLLLLSIWPLATLPLSLVVLLISSIAALLLLPRWPWLAWIGLAIVLPVSSGIQIGPVSLTDVGLAATLALWFVDGVRRRTLRLTFSPLVIAILGYSLVLLLSLYEAVNLGEGIAEVVKWVQVAVVVVVLRQMLPQHQVHWLVAALLVGGIGQALLGLYQFIFRIGPDWFMIMERFMRASGSFGQPNPYAGYLGLCLPVATSLALATWQHLRPRHTKNRQSPILNLPYLWALFYTGAAGLLGVALLASWSRGGWLGAATGLAIVVFLRSRQAMAWGVSSLLAFVLVILLGSTLPDWIPAPVVARLQDIPAYLGLTDLLSQPVTEENFAVMERLAHWVAALRMWESAPWLGVGPGNYGTVYPTVRLPLWEEPLGHAHNIYLNTLAETGLVGFGGYLALWGVIILWLWRQYQRATEQQAHWQAALALGVLGVVGHLTVHNFFDNLFVQGMYLQIAFWLTALTFALPDQAHA